MSRPVSVVLAGGGTGGHIEPALAFAECLRRHDPEIRVTCLGTPRGLEREIIPQRGWDLELIPAYPLPRRLGVAALRTPHRIWKATRAARRILDQVEADVVVGFGGYVAVPAYLAARQRRTPLVIHEKDTPPGIANRLGARLTEHIALGFPHQLTQGQVGRHASAEVVGVPLRRSIAVLDRAASRRDARVALGLDPDRATLLVFGGSQGARSVNLAVQEAVPDFVAAGMQVLHLTGARNDGVETHSAGYVSRPFLESMEQAYSAADLVLCRGGAMTCAELAAVGLPAIYVPYPHGNGEQRRNALPVVSAGGGLLVEDEALNATWLKANVLPLMSDAATLTEMSARAAEYGRRDGDEALRDLMLRALADSRLAVRR